MPPVLTAGAGPTGLARALSLACDGENPVGLAGACRGSPRACRGSLA